jgi:putative ABC transport system substrate-binding protein
MNSRRKLLVALGAGALVVPLSSLAQMHKVYRIGMLYSGSPESGNRVLEAFIQGLRELGYVEGDNIQFERRFAEGSNDRLPALASDLVQRNVDVIFSAGTTTTLAAKQATGTIPIVFASVGDPIGSGFVTSLARPGGNITGVSNFTTELSAKRLQLLREVIPKISRVAVVISDDSVAAVQLPEVERAAKGFGVEVFAVKVQRRDDFEPGFTELRKRRVDAMYILETPLNFFNRMLLAEFAAKLSLPAVSAVKGYTEAGALLSYGPSYESIFRRAATYVARILKGANPGDLPIEQPTKFELVINLKTAKALGLTIPQRLLLEAEEVIQ